MKTEAKSRRSAFRICALLAAIFLNHSLSAKDLYVSPSGSNQNDGSVESPFATIAHAQTVVRNFKGQNPSEPITVYLRGGKYYLTEPVVFGAEDSGSEEAPIAYKANEEEIPQILGGVSLPGLKWEQYEGKNLQNQSPRGHGF